VFDVPGGGTIANRLDMELAELAGTAPRRVGPPLRAVALLARVQGELEPGATDTLTRRRHRGAARQLARLSANAAACLHGAFGDRPDLDRALPRALDELRVRARRPGPGCAQALSEVARCALALPPVADGEDWQLDAIAFVDEALLREGYDACLTLAAVALREAASA
jgi:hypothetical protein